MLEVWQQNERHFFYQQKCMTSYGKGRMLTTAQWLQRLGFDLKRNSYEPPTTM